MKKPIILGVRGECREIVEKAGSGIGIEPENGRSGDRSHVMTLQSFCRPRPSKSPFCLEITAIPA